MHTCIHPQPQPQTYTHAHIRFRIFSQLLKSIEFFKKYFVCGVRNFDQMFYAVLLKFSNIFIFHIKMSAFKMFIFVALITISNLSLSVLFRKKNEV